MINMLLAPKLKHNLITTIIVYTIPTIKLNAVIYFTLYCFNTLLAFKNPLDLIC